MSDSRKVPIRLDLNRVEGDLQIEVWQEEGIITQANCVGTMYRGFEQIMLGRDALDALVITPRICGICGTAHLNAAVMALEHAFNIPVAANGIRIRNICQLAEEIQSDIRQTFLMFCVDLCAEQYGAQAEYARIVQAFQAFQGKHHIQAVQHSKKMVEIVAIFGGQWPHSSYMLPGGVSTLLDSHKIIETSNLLESRIRWYEQEILGCELQQWLDMDKADRLLDWLADEQQQSAAALFTRFCRALKIHQLGRGCSNLLSFGSAIDPQKWHPPYGEQHCLQRAGFYNQETAIVEELDHLAIREDLSHSWFSDPQGKPSHPWEGTTIPNYLPDSQAYSWAKAPRYQGKACQTGAMAQLVVAGDPLIKELFESEGDNAWLRQFSRIHRPVHSFLMMRQMLNELQQHIQDSPIINSQLPSSGQGYGLLMAARGALGHWLEIEQGKISRYQIVTPTAWNASPKDHMQQPGHMESSLIGVKMDNERESLAVGHVIRSNDPCLVCTVHHLTGDRERIEQAKMIRYSPYGSVG